MTVFELIACFAACAYFLKKLRTKMFYHYRDYKRRISVQQLSILIFAGSSIVDEAFLLKDIETDTTSKMEDFFQTMSLLLQTICVFVLISSRLPVTDYFHVFNRLQNVRYSCFESEMREPELPVVETQDEMVDSTTRLNMAGDRIDSFT